MSPRTRRLVIGISAVVLLLLLGRFMVELLATRWWARAVSPAALHLTTRWQLLGAILDLTGILVASAWFALQAMVAARAVASVQVEHRIGGVSLRELLPTRLLLAGGLMLGVLLGLITGSGAREWRLPVALALEGVHFGIADPVTGADLGTWVARLPVWELAHSFAATLVVLGLILSALLYLAIGGLRWRRPRLHLHPDARRHLGSLLVLLALVIAWGYMLEPYHLAANSLTLLGTTAIGTRVIASHAMVGASIAVAILTTLWVVRSRQSLVLAGWMVLAIAAMFEQVVVPAFVAESARPSRESDLHARVDSVMYGLSLNAARPDSATAAVPSDAGVWQRPSLARWVHSRGGSMLIADPVRRGSVQGGGTWQVVSNPGGESVRLEVATIHPDSTANGGLPVELEPKQVIDDVTSFPGAPEWLPSSGGVWLGSPLRRIILAWARQAPGMLSINDNRVDWTLDPLTRIKALVPALDWQLAGLVESQGEAAWLLLGNIRVASMPLATRVALGPGRGEASGYRAGMVATVSVAAGQVAVWSDPAAGPLGEAWAAVYAPLVRPAGELPRALRQILPYSTEWFRAQLAVIDSHNSGSINSVTTNTAVVIHTFWRGRPAVQALLLERNQNRPDQLVTGTRVDGNPRLAQQQVPPLAAVGLDQLSRAWRNLPGFRHLIDSIRAVGDSLVAGPLRGAVTTTGLKLWQPFFSAGLKGAPALIWVGSAVQGSLSGGTDVATAWHRLAGDASGSRPDGIDIEARYRAARTWLLRADSALARRDMTAFGRAWEALRNQLLEGPDR